MIYLLNGPNLNMLGVRSVNIYGKTSLRKIEENCINLAKERGYNICCKQSNCEGELIHCIHNAFEDAQGLIINPGALSHTSLALADAIEIFNVPVIEIHISNIYKREPIRKHSFISSVVHATIAGLGANGYTLALNELINIIERKIEQ